MPLENCSSMQEEEKEDGEEAEEFLNHYKNDL